MTQITSGIRSLLSSPIVYTLFQTIMGAHAVRLVWVNEFVKPTQAMSILDIGCGPADILEYLPKVDYYGFDISAAYIERARSRFPDRGNFYCKLFTASDLVNLPLFDVVLVSAVLHHMDDDSAQELLGLVHQALKPSGRLVTLDPCLVPAQNPIARFLIKRDRGQNVRTPESYEQLASRFFSNRRVEVRHKAGIPYTHCFMECTK